MSSIVDDGDNQIEYLGEWELGGEGGGEFNGTSHGTFTAGARVTFTFYGESIPNVTGFQCRLTTPYRLFCGGLRNPDESSR
jgi:hypothetical protein